MALLDDETHAKVAADKCNWGARAPIHVASEFYGAGDRDPTNWCAPFEWRGLGWLDALHYEWPHGLGEVITAVAQAGLTIESLTETRLLVWPRWPLMVRVDNGWWAMPESEPRFLVLYGLKAMKR